MPIRLPGSRVMAASKLFPTTTVPVLFSSCEFGIREDRFRFVCLVIYVCFHFMSALFAYSEPQEAGLRIGVNRQNRGMYVWSSHIARVRINWIKLPILLVGS